MNKFLHIFSLIIFNLFITISASAVEITKHGAPSAHQTLKPGEEVALFYYSVSPANCDIEITGLPQGVDYKISDDNTRIDIFGLPDVEIGRYKFRIIVTKDGESDVRTGTIIVKDKLIFAEDESVLNQTIDDNEQIVPINFYFRKGVKINPLMPEGMTLSLKDNELCTLEGTPALLGLSYIRVYAEMNGVMDTLFISVNVLKDGLIKTNKGNTSQVVELYEDIEPISFRWECKGNLTIENNMDGIKIDVNKDNKNIMIKGAPRSLGKHTAKINFETKNSVTEYNIEIVAIEGKEPVITIISREETINQSIPLRSSIEDIKFLVENADSIAVIGLPNGLVSSFDKAVNELTISGTLREEGAFMIIIRSFNKQRETQAEVYVSSLNTLPMSLSTILSEKNIDILSVSILDLNGRILRKFSLNEFLQSDFSLGGVYILEIQTTNGVRIIKYQK